MPRLACLLTAILLAISCSQKSPDGAVNHRIERFENGLVEFTSVQDLFQFGVARGEKLRSLSERMTFYRTPGMSMAVIKDFGLDWAKPYGILRAGEGESVALNSYFEAASTSKMVTAAIVLHYVEKGILGLDEDVNGYLKTWKLPENELTRRQPVTLRLLLTHQAGMPASNFEQEANAGDPTLVQSLNGEKPALNKPAVVEYVPGSRWQYSNIGYVVIQQILEDAIGRPFPRVARETVFEPLGMKDSTFSYPLGGNLQANEAWPHDAKGILQRPEMVPHAQAHGGLMTTPTDLALFGIELMQAFNGRSERLLSKDMARRMFTKALELDPKLFGFPCGEGLGVFLYGDGDNLVFLHPGGNLPGMICWLFGYPNTGRGGAVMLNGAGGEILALEIIAALNREYGNK